MATGQEVFDRAAQRSSLNDTSLVDATKYIRFISDLEKRIFLRAAQLNPDYFGKDAITSVRAHFGDSWNLLSVPGDVGAVARVDVQTIIGAVTGVVVGDQVNLVSIRWPDVEVSPRAYLRGGNLTGYKTELGAADANMVSSVRVWYAERPADVTAMAQQLRTPEEWLDMIVLPMARIFAIYDRRLDEVEHLNAELTTVQENFEMAVLAFDHGVRRPLTAVPPLGIAPPQGR